MAQHESRLDRAVVPVDLQPHGGVDRLPGLGGQRAAAAEGHAARTRAAGGQRERDVPPLAQRPRIVEQRARHQQRRLGVAHAERGQALELLGQVEPQHIAGHDRVDPLHGDQILGREHRPGMGDERLPERLHAPARDGQAGRGTVPAVAQQLVARRVQPAQQVERRDRAARASALVSLQRDEDGRPVAALRDPRGDDPDHARMPAVRRQHIRGRIGAAERRALLGHLRLGLEQDPRLDVPPLDVDRVELGRDGLGARHVGGQ
jgi:hypothetical protein